ncbi:MAG: tetratricopeptide (TPR) repeat protein [Gammaproteobacteria bacterium]
MSNVLALAPNNPRVLRIVAGYFEQFGREKEALLVYEQVAVLRPLEVQSQRDLAMIYEINGDYVKAVELYNRMLVNAIDDIDFSPIRPLLNNELNRIIVLHGPEVVSESVLNSFCQHIARLTEG